MHNGNRCEAIVITRDGAKLKPGGQCREVATDKYCNRHVCWTHEKAAQNPYRKLAFVVKK